MRHLFFDTETELFAAGYMAPEIVCLQYCYDTGPAQLLHARTQREDMLAVVRDALRDSNCMLVGHNVAYDLVCLAALDPDLLPLIFAAYEDNRITDTMFRQKLVDIARGRYRTRQYDLASCGEIHGYPQTLDKSDPWRLRYAELAAVSVAYWPPSAVAYALKDADATRWVYQSQAARYHRTWLCDEFNQARKFFCLRLMEVWGIRTDERGVESLRIGAVQEIESRRGLLEDYGLVSRKKDGTWKRNMKAVRTRIKEAYAAQGKDYPRPKQQKDKVTGKLKPLSLNPATDNDACMQASDYVLEQYAEYSRMCKVLAADVPMLAAGCHEPIHTHFDIVESGRTSSASPNIQNPRRMVGVRECFVPRRGFVYLDADQSALELRTVAQVCKRLVGYSRLADVLNKRDELRIQDAAGKWIKYVENDPHTALAANTLGVGYGAFVLNAKDAEYDNQRTMAKGMNFGFPGGLGAKSFPAFAWRAYKVKITEAEVKLRKEEWLAAYPEFRDYHRFIGDTYEAGVTHLFSNRIRGRVTFTSGANSYFQGLGADVCGGSLWEVTKACYAVRTSALYGARPVNFMHDSILTECEPAQAHEGLAEQERLMIVGGAPWLPDVPPLVDGKIMTRWSKDAARLVRGDKRVIAWDPLIVGESVESYAARHDAPVEVVAKSWDGQRKAHEKLAARRATDARRAEEFMAALAAEAQEAAA